MKKLLVLSALFAALLFFACGEKQESSAPAKDADATVEPAAAQDTAPDAEDEVAADEDSEN